MNQVSSFLQILALTSKQSRESIARESIVPEATIPILRPVGSASRGTAQRQTSRTRGRRWFLEGSNGVVCFSGRVPQCLVIWIAHSPEYSGQCLSHMNVDHPSWVSTVLRLGICQLDFAMQVLFPTVEADPVAGGQREVLRGMMPAVAAVCIAQRGLQCCAIQVVEGIASEKQ